MSTAPRPPIAPLSLSLVLAKLDVGDAEDALRTVAGQLLDAGAVTDAFPEALQVWERRYPTGLPTPVPTAIPHADPEHVLVPGLALVTLARPVPFGEMGGSGGEVPVQLLAMPLLTDARDHLAALRRLMSLLQGGTAVAELIAAEDEETLRARAEELLGRTGETEENA